MNNFWVVIIFTMIPKNIIGRRGVLLIVVVLATNNDILFLAPGYIVRRYDSGTRHSLAVVGICCRYLNKMHGPWKTIIASILSKTSTGLKLSHCLRVQQQRWKTILYELLSNSIVLFSVIINDFEKYNPSFSLCKSWGTISEPWKFDGHCIHDKLQ